MLRRQLIQAMSIGFATDLMIQPFAHAQSSYPNKPHQSHCAFGRWQCG